MSVRRSAALALVAALVLAGCQDEPEPRFDPTPSDSSSPTDPETDEPAAQTAEEFIEEWFRVNTEMQNTGDSAEFRGISPSCRPCTRLAEQVDGFYGAGGYVRIDHQVVRKVTNLSRTEYLATVDAAPTEYRTSSESKIQRLEGGQTEYRVILRQRNGSWEMAHYFDSTS